MLEITKNLLFITSVISGTLILISLFIIVTIKLICIALDNLKIGNIIKECLIIYVKQKRPDLEIKKEDIDFTKGRIKRK